MTPADVLTDAEETLLRGNVPPTAAPVARPTLCASVDPVPIGDPDEDEGYDDEDEDEDEEDDEEPLQCAWRSSAGPAAMTTARRFFIVLEPQIPVRAQ